MNGFKELMKKSLSLAYVVSFTSAEHIFNQTRYLPLTCELETQLLGYHLWHVSILIAKLIQELHISKIESATTTAICLYCKKLVLDL